jgi:hypothetical protein
MKKKDHRKVDLSVPDQINAMLEFIKYVEGSRKKPSRQMIYDRDRWFATMIFTTITDPKHHVGKVVGRSSFKTWIQKGGQVPKEGALDRALKEPGQFLFSVQYLYDYGLSVNEIAMALGCYPLTVKKNITWLNVDNRKEQIRNELDIDAERLGIDDYVRKL